MRGERIGTGRISRSVWWFFPRSYTVPDGLTDVSQELHSRVAARNNERRENTTKGREDVLKPLMLLACHGTHAT